MSRKRHGIGQFRHRLRLCAQNDVVIDGELRLNREGIRTARAMVVEKKAQTFSRQGASMKESQDQRTHKVYIRHMTDLLISTYAWLYEERRKSPPRWFKVLSVTETEMGGNRFYEFECRLVERADNVPRPDQPLEEPKNGLDPVVSMPEGVTL